MAEETPTAIRVKKKVKGAINAADDLLNYIKLDFARTSFTREEVLGKYADARGYLKADIGSWKNAEFRVLNLLGLLVQNQFLEQLSENVFKIKVW